jgi:plasmid stability protein
MFLRSNVTGRTRVILTSRVPTSLKRRLEARSARSGFKLSAVAADLLEFALELEERLEPFRLAIERLVRAENLSAPEAVATLLWMDVELDPQPVASASAPASPDQPGSPRGRDPSGS